MSKQLRSGDYCTILGDESGTIYGYRGVDPSNKKHVLRDEVTGNITFTRTEPIKATRPKGKASAEALILDQAEEIAGLKAEAERKAQEYGDLAQLCDAQAECLDKISQACGGPSSAQGIDLDALVEQVKILVAKATSMPEPGK